MKAGRTGDGSLAPDIDSILDRAAALLHAGELVGVPTETVYGLAADATNPVAVARLFERKGRASFQPISVLCGSSEMAFGLLANVPESAARLAARFWPGPLTLILRKRAEALPDLLTAGLPFVGVRIPDHPLTLALLERFGGPLAAPSANRSGHLSPTTARAVEDEFGEEIALVLDGGPCRVGVESTVVSLVHRRPILIRLGGIPQELLEEEIGSVDRETDSPCLSHRHYMLRTPLFLVRTPEAILLPERKEAGFLAWGPCPEGFSLCRSLSLTYRLDEAAGNLFRQLHELDDCGLRRIYAVLLPDRGLGCAINERLRKAADASASSGNLPEGGYASSPASPSSS
ncbi:L-threonylcarbamoyladenylate synthase [Methylacidimicrobium sp. B4]|uniref:L-threonylcarbamoyladenylate synthase n=1 Tax=Methylacidimicrobium sp. B4 TaxID=2796139 RepID=UPI001A8C3AA2|nr:L-threonylcarbamoyladenylate synthase [Methylacidimicrobium sp. B4]QSR83889.1 threonylcarbamoyl-AMP synthase [Methylacidimicrobium sp. B4]